MKKVMSYLHDIPRQLSVAEEAELAALAARPDNDIDTSDIPELTSDWFKKASRPGLYRPVKHQVTTRLDADVLEWLKSRSSSPFGSCGSISPTKPDQGMFSSISSSNIPDDYHGRLAQTHPA